MTDALMELWGELGVLKHEGTGKQDRFGFFPHEARASTLLGVAQKVRGSKEVEPLDEGKQSCSEHCLSLPAYTSAPNFYF